MTESLNCPPKTHNIVNQLYFNTKLTVFFLNKKQVMEKREKEKAFSVEKAVNSGLKETETERNYDHSCSFFKKICFSVADLQCCIKLSYTAQ